MQSLAPPAEHRDTDTKRPRGDTQLHHNKDKTYSSTVIFWYKVLELNTKTILKKLNQPY